MPDMIKNSESDSADRPEEKKTSTALSDKDKKPAANTGDGMSEERLPSESARPSDIANFRGVKKSKRKDSPSRAEAKAAKKDAAQKAKDAKKAAKKAEQKAKKANKAADKAQKRADKAAAAAK